MQAIMILEAPHISTAKDKNLIYAKLFYYGVIENIWELNYTQFKIPVFWCKWVDNKGGVKVDENDFTLVDLNKEVIPMINSYSHPKSNKSSMSMIQTVGDGL